MTKLPTGRQAAVAIAWTAAAKWTGQIVSWVSLFVVIRILSPADFGLFGLANTYLGLLTILGEFGVGSAVVMMRDLDSRHHEQLNFFSVVLGVAAVLISALLAWPIGAFFKMPQLPAVLIALSFSFLISSFRSVPSALLQKRLEFRFLSLLEAIQAIIQALVTVSLALAGFMYWSLVGGALVGVFVSAVLIAQWSPKIGFAWPDWRHISEAITFSKQVVFSRISWYAYSNADFVIVGRMLGAEPLGIYTLAWNFANLPVEKLTTLVLRVTPAFFSRWSVDIENLKRKFVLLTEGMAVILFPCVLGLMVLSEDFIAIAAGAKWSAAARPQQLLVSSALFRSVATLVPQILTVLGAIRVTMWNSIATCAVLIPGFYFGSRWGVEGVASIWLVLYPLSVLVMFRICFRLLNLPIREYAFGLLAPITSSVTMVVLVFLVRRSLPVPWPVTVKAAIAVATGVAVYALCLRLLFPSRLLKYRELLVNLRS